MAAPMQNKFADMTMAERKRFVAKRCRKVRKWSDEEELAQVKAMILYNKKHKLMACNNRKVGSSTISAVFQNISTTNANLSRHDVRLKFRMRHLERSLTPEFIKNSSAKKFMFVREPLKRLFSAYGQGRGVRKDRNKKSKVSFATFLEDVLKVDDYRQTNHHHLSYFYGCRPCDIEYDYIGTMETFEDDLKYILRQFNIDVGLVPHWNDKTGHDSNDVMENVPKDLKVKIWERYKEDYVMFGYPHPTKTNYTVV